MVTEVEEVSHVIFGHIMVVKVVSLVAIMIIIRVEILVAVWCWGGGVGVGR